MARKTGTHLWTFHSLREGLLPPGTSRGRTQADYGDDHVRRLRLIRTLIEVGGLAIADVHAVVAAVDDESLSLHDAFGVAHDAITPRHGLGDDDERAAVHKLRRGEVTAIIGNYLILVRFAREQGLPELVTRSLEEYESLARRLASSPVELAALKSRLATNRATAPLFDTDLFRRNIETAYEIMHERALRGEAPRSFVVPSAQ